MIDLHSHLLPGLDDGSRSLEESVAIARAMASDGIRCVAATPHVNERWPTTAAAMEQRLEEVRTAVAEAGIPLDVRGGAEIALEMLPALSPQERSRLGLGGNPGCLLLEFPYFGWPLDLADTVSRLKHEGVVPVVAHPERNTEVQEDPTRLEPIVRAGAMVQVTASTLTGRHGPRLRAVARTLVDDGLAHLVAGDTHAAGTGAGGLVAACAALEDDALARWLTDAVPAALLDGRPLPERPAAARRRGWRGWRGR